jgi:hypothetical protein
MIGGFMVHVNSFSEGSLVAGGGRCVRDVMLEGRRTKMSH